MRFWLLQSGAPPGREKTALLINDFASSAFAATTCLRSRCVADRQAAAAVHATGKWACAERTYRPELPTPERRRPRLKQLLCFLLTQTRKSCDSTARKRRRQRQAQRSTTDHIQNTTRPTRSERAHFSDKSETTSNLSVTQTITATHTRRAQRRESDQEIGPQRTNAVRRTLTTQVQGKEYDNAYNHYPPD